MDEHNPTRRSVLKTTATLAAAGSLTATAGCLGGGAGSGPDLDGEITVEGPAESLSTERSLAATDAGYELSITVSNGSDTPVDCGAEIVWTDGSGENVASTGTETSTADPDSDATLVTTVEDPEDAISAYSATVVAAPA
jgi:hypothetical protein